MAENDLMQPKYGMYKKLMKHLREIDVTTFKNFVRVDPESFSIMIEDLSP
jgi:hypothetical protein